MKLSLRERDTNFIWHPYTQHKNMVPPIPIVRGKGSLLYDESGNSYIDVISSWWVTLHGHGHPFIAESIYRQALQLEQVIFTSFTHEPAVTLAENLLAVLPANQSKIFYSDNGSTAVEVALKMAIQYWKNRGEKQKTKILAFEHAYHGDTFGAMSVSGRGLFTQAFGDFLFETVFIETPCADNIDEIKSRILEHRGRFAAFIYEPLLQAAGGMRMYEADSMNELLSFVRSENILCIADEVLTGFGRTGSLFASEKLRPGPDIVCMSKGLTGGAMALGCTSCSREIFEAFLSDDRRMTFFHGHSFTANPLACAAALASLELLKNPSCQEQIRAIQQQHEQFLEEVRASERKNLFRNLRMLGTVLAFETAGEHPDYLQQIGSMIMKRAMEQGIYLRPLGNTVYLMPPYCITNDELRKVYDFILDPAFAQ